MSVTFRSISRNRWIAAAAACAAIPLAVLLVRFWDAAPPASVGDYAQYLLHARAIVDGRPYTDTGYLYSELNPWIGPRAYPPGLPLALAPLVALVGTDSPVYAALMVACWLAFVALAAWRLGTRHSAWTGLSAAVVAGVAVQVSGATVVAGSDLAFCALVWMLIVAIDRDGEWDLKRAILVALIGGAAMSFRLAGVAIVPSLAVWAWLNRKRSGWRPAIPLAVWGAAGIAVAVLFRQALASQAMYGVPLADRLARMMVRLRTYRLSLFEAELYPFTADGANDVYHLLVTVVVAAGLAILLWRERRTFLPVFAAVCALMLLMVDVVDSRYFWPLFPLVGAALFEGTRAVIAMARATRASVPLAFVLVIALGLVSAGRSSMRPDPPSLDTDAPSIALMAFLRQLRATEVPHVVFPNPRVLTLKTGIPAMGYFRQTRPESVLAEFDRLGITHVVVGGADITEAPSTGLDGILLEHPERFRPVWSNERYRVLRYAPSAR